MYDSAKDTTTVLKVLSLRDTENEMINIMKKKRSVTRRKSVRKVRSFHNVGHNEAYRPVSEKKRKEKS